jgi:transcriptional regulator with XRE-family HTH domain
MNDQVAEGQGLLQVGTVGQRLRMAREAMGLTLAQVADRSRIALRHLAAIEDGAFASLPGRTYALGFTRTYARIVGLDEAQAVAEVREQLDSSAAEAPPRHDSFEPGDPARVPSARLGWVSVAVVLLLLVLAYVLLPRLFVPAAELPALPDRAAPTPTPAPGATGSVAGAAQGTQPAGPVVFTALEEGIWVKFYDADGRQLMQKLMALGETYQVPEDVAGPQLWTARPDALAITIGGRPVPPIATQQGNLRDVPVSRSALLARPRPVAPTPAPNGAAVSPDTTAE